MLGILPFQLTLFTLLICWYFFINTSIMHNLLLSTLPFKQSILFLYLLSGENSVFFTSVSGPRFLILANMCSSAGFLQNFADMCRFEKITYSAKPYKLHSDVKLIIKIFKTGEKSHLRRNDGTFFYSNLYRSVKNSSELCRSIKNPE